jgi:alkanesulfonate monooxygenase SsuD/methylene tetrahydromethanopterin reductase-like flavin-dependent oxidoreductase (luciferase family)
VHALLSGAEVFQDPYYTVDDVRLLPTSIQDRIPTWIRGK